MTDRTPRKKKKRVPPFERELRAQNRLNLIAIHYYEDTGKLLFEP